MSREFASEILQTAWQREGEPKYFRALEDKARKVLGVKPQFSHGAVSGKVVQQGYVAVKNENVIFPSLAFGGEKGALVFTLVGPDFYPSAAYVGVGEDGASAVHIAANGAAPDDGFSGYIFYSGGNVGRWGDYSAAVSDGRNVWLSTEYIPNLPRTPLADWGTFVFKVRP